MLSETLERVNQRRKQAMSDPQYQKAAKQHTQAIAQATPQPHPMKRKKKTLAEYYQPHIVTDPWL